MHDDYDVILAALQKLDFLCGRFIGTGQSTYEWGGEGSPREETFQAEWVMEGFYLQEGTLGDRRFCFWGYDPVAHVYRRWLFAKYGHFGRGFPDPYGAVGAFEGDRLIMTVEYQSNIPIGMAGKPIGNRGMKFVYKPEQNGAFSMTQHGCKRGSGNEETFPGYYKCSEVLFMRENTPGAP